MLIINSITGLSTVEFNNDTTLRLLYKNSTMEVAYINLEEYFNFINFKLNLIFMYKKMKSTKIYTYVSRKDIGKDLYKINKSIQASLDLQKVLNNLFKSIMFLDVIDNENNIIRYIDTSIYHYNYSLLKMLMDPKYTDGEEVCKELNSYGKITPTFLAYQDCKFRAHYNDELEE